MRRVRPDLNRVEAGERTNTASASDVAVVWEPTRRRATAAVALLWQDLERRELSDVRAVRSISRFIAKPFRRRGATNRTGKRLLEGLALKWEQSVATGRHLLAGALSAAVCKTVVAPVERVRMDIILSNTPHGPQGTCMEILQKEGISGFWKGNLLNIIRTAPFKAVNFYTFDMYCKMFVGLSNRDEVGDLERFTAGAMAGITALVTCLPLDTVRTRLLSTRSGHQYNGLLHAFTQIAHTEGFLALYKGCVPGIMSIAPGSAVFYGVYGTLKEAHLRKTRQHKREALGPSGMELPVWHSLLYGAIAGMCSEAVVYPLEVIRRQIQLQTGKGVLRLANGTVVRNGVGQSLQSFAAACNTIVQTQGPGGFYAGCLLNTAQVLPSAALSYLAYETFKVLLRVDQKDKEDK